MGTRDRVAVAFPPLLIRVVLGATMLWAGLGKLVATNDYQPEQLAILANLGVDIPAATAPDDTDGTEQDTPPANDPTPGTLPEPDAEVVEDLDLDAVPGDLPDDAETPEADAPTIDEVRGPASAFSLRLVQDESPARTFAPSDFDGPREMKRVYGIALLLHARANPGLDDEGNELMPLVPEIAVRDKNAVILAWASGITEVAAGIFLIVGFLTRLSALSIVGVMGTAMWLTQIGPAIQAGTATWGFLPAPGIFEINAIGQYAWTMFFWQLALFTMAFAIVFSGSGKPAIDRLLFHAKSRSADDDD